ncbi:hypothetical protein [Georgenia faecalis]|uniref:LemA family protein n=1 Tax=Georgenia faecalis TaxID=2483799 RepID=A0ABV9DEV3_9MICO|nr:hypothetical protein [Georgenia faecalis]
MSGEGWALVALLAAVVVGWILWIQASRVDRLHRKVLRSRATLEAQLAQRASAALELATSGALDPVESILVADVARRAASSAPAGVVHDGLEGTPDDDAPTVPDVDRALVESELSRTLRAVLAGHEDITDLADHPAAGDALGRLEHAWYRLEIARRFHNAHVAEVRRMRSRPLVRTLRLAGHAPMPAAFDMDDVPPSAWRTGA